MWRQRQAINDLKSLKPTYEPSGFFHALERCTFLDLRCKLLPLFPPGVASLTKLECLWLGYNSLSALPPDIELLTGLSELDVRNNHLDRLPSGVSQLTGLVHLDISGNRLSELPTSLAVLTQLSVLAVQDNPINELPVWITGLTKLKELLIECDGRISIKRAPCSITTLPCYSNTWRTWTFMKLSYKDALDTLQFYDSPPTLDVHNITLPKASSTSAAEALSVTPWSPKQKSDPKDSEIQDDDEPALGEFVKIMEVDIENQPILGEGGFGITYKVSLNKKLFAVKVLKKKVKPRTPEYDSLTREARIMINLQHENIIALHSYGCKSQKIFYIMEYADGQSLWDLLQTSGALTTETCILYSLHINRGLAYLHSRSPPIEHRDLKPENVLLCGGIAKICDFGTSCARETVSRTTGFQGTFNYAAPEAFDFKGYGPMSDMYTFALVIWSMLSGLRPYDDMNYGQIMAQKLHQKLPDIPKTCPLRLARVMIECWSLEPRQRPTATRLDSVLDEIRVYPGELLESGRGFSLSRESSIQPARKQVSQLNNEELVQFLIDMNASQKIVDAVLASKATGVMVLELSEADLMDEPFRLAKFEAKFLLKIIQGTESR